MRRLGRPSALSSAVLVFVLAGSSIGFLALAGGAGALSAGASGAPPTTLPGVTFVAGPPAGAHGPDDLTYVAPPPWNPAADLIWTAYQNGINPNGTPGTTGGPTQSTIAGYDPLTGALVHTINVTGKVDGLTMDPALGKLVATVNEDDNSAMYLVDPYTGVAVLFTYSPSPAVNGVGGTDSIAIWGGQIYLDHSNPNDTAQATVYLATLNSHTHVASLSAVYYDDSVATDASTGAALTLALTDPDSNLVMPGVSPHYAGQLAEVSQGDGRIIFASSPTSPVLTQLNLTDNVSGNLPPIDGLAVATSGNGTLYVVDAGAGNVQAFQTAGWPAGTVFVGEPNDNGNPLIGTLNLTTGHITPLLNHMVSPKGMLFLANPVHGHGGHGGGDGDGDGDDGAHGGHDDGRVLEARGGILARLD